MLYILAHQRKRVYSCLTSLLSGAQARVEADVKLPDTPGVASRTMFLEKDSGGAWRVSDPG